MLDHLDISSVNLITPALFEQNWNEVWKRPSNTETVIQKDSPFFYQALRISSRC